MALRASVTDRPLDLPPPYDLVTLRESGDAFARALETAGASGAGTLVWVRRFDVAEFAVVLEPEEPLRTAQRAFYLGMNALADALAVHAPPERPIAFDWPDAIRIDGVLIGGGRLGWPAGAAEEETPDWLVFGAMLRTAVLRAGDPGLRPLLGSLEELGFEGVDAGELLASFARHLLAGLHDFGEIGFAPAGKRWLGRMARGAGRNAIAENGDLLAFDASGRKGQRRSLVKALAVPSWRDPQTGMPWL
jgi:hypothetical protein